MKRKEHVSLRFRKPRESATETILTPWRASVHGVKREKCGQVVRRKSFCESARLSVTAVRGKPFLEQEQESVIARLRAMVAR